MPNWCNNYITFFSDGSPEGDAALQDLHNKIIETEKLIKQIHDPNSYRNNGELWEVYLANYGFGVEVQDCYQRGYIWYVSDISYDNFSVECDDAWSPNIMFWQALLHYAYGNKISFTFQAIEPGMGIYETNDPGLLPRFHLSLCADGVDQVLGFDKLWDWSNPLFPMLVSNEVNISNPCFIPNFYDRSKPGRYYPATPSLYTDFEGDEDEVLDFIDEYKTLGDDIKCVADVDCEDNMHINSFVYVDTDKMIESEKLCMNICEHITHEPVTIDENRGYGMVTPIYDNFTTFLGGENNE